jgi:tetratricopeptide (TPR) repeat protein
MPSSLRRIQLRLALLVLLPVLPWPAGAQTATGTQTATEARTASGRPWARITEEIRTLDTYPFSEPNPVPILVRDARLYPYHSFEGYSVGPRPMEWKVVKLENEWIEVFVLPEVGGKVWGAVVKETGHEFIYRNEVMKFRNIALRGPWTSGGIEFNFGVIGHTPATATPVDYRLEENPDGSVSCWVGAMDLPSRTHWRVEIRLPADRAYFETNVLWYNPTPLEQPYYNWMTAAAFAQDDLVMSMPGNAYLRHSGEVESWPVDDEGRYLAPYANNTFQGHKSYHVVGELNDFFGGYYQEDDYGFGHWARHEDMPGQKLWLWALSREGGVWEDLLTDTDGQYVEFQAGRLFVQYSPGSHLNPITQAGFDPMSASRWTETWFPLEGTGGLSDASRDGAMFASEADGRLTVAVNSFKAIQDTLKVWSNGELVGIAALELEPLETFRTEFDIGPDRAFQAQVAGLDLDYDSSPRSRTLLRPFSRNLDEVPPLPETQRMIFEARELMKARLHREAQDLFEEVQRRESSNREAILGLAELAYRNGDVNLALRWANQALQMDAYDPRANFLAGLVYRIPSGPQDVANAMDAFGWAARSTAYRSAAYVQMAEIMMTEGDFPEAQRYARLGIDFDRHSIPGWRALAVIGRLSGAEVLAEEALGELLAVDPVHHFAFAEQYLAAVGKAGRADERSANLAASEAREAFLGGLRGEYPDQTLMELVVGYSNLGLKDDALKLLEDLRDPGPTPPLFQLWEAWLREDESLLDQPEEPSFQFPFRRETGWALAWAAGKSDSWVWAYLASLQRWHAGDDDAASNFFQIPGNEPEFAPYYVARAHLLDRTQGRNPEPDLRKAVEVDPENRIMHIYLIQALQREGMWEEALTATEDAKVRFLDDFNLDLLRAKALINLGRPLEASEILAHTHVLPSENARESHSLWEQAHIMAALDSYDDGKFLGAKGHLERAMSWPENLGQGRPYEPEERLARFILAEVEDRLGDQAAARESYQAYLEATGVVGVAPISLDLLAPGALRGLGREPEAGALLRERAVQFEALRVGLAETLEGRLILRALDLGGGRE